jgi:AcrR family transcriptional regulator
MNPPVPRVAPAPAKKPRVGGRSARVLEQVALAVADEFRECGLAAFSVPSVAHRAGVHTATIYRRWPTTAALIAFAAGSLAKRALPVPDTGSLAGDLRSTLVHVRMFLEGPDSAMLMAIFFAGGDAPELQEVRQLYWSERIAGRDAMFKRARSRGEIRQRKDLEDLIEMAIGPLYVRRFISRRPIEDAFIDRIVAGVTRV